VTKKTTFALLVLASLVSAIAQAAEPLALSGRVFTDVYAPVRDADTAPYRLNSASLWLQGDAKAGDATSGRFVLDATTNAPYLVVREAYADYFKNGFELRAGQLIVPWGKSDAINPTDFLSAKNLTRFNPDEEVRRLGAPILWAAWTPSGGTSPLTFTVVAVPVFAQTQLLIPPTAVPTGVNLNTQPNVATPTLANTETALKIAYNGSSWDASLTAFRGWNHAPDLYVVAPPASLGFTFHHVRALGGDASFTSGKWIFRAESAYVWTETDPLVEPAHWDSVLGVERPLGDDFRIQAQLYVRTHPSYVDPFGPVANANALLQGYQFATRESFTLRFSYDRESWAAELFALANVQGGDYLLRPKATYSISDALKATAGLDWYAGPDDRMLGAMKAYSSVFLEAKYLF
jgi:hypothetical protein